MGDGVPKDQLEVESDKNKQKKKRGKRRTVEETLDEEEKNAEVREHPSAISIAGVHIQQNAPANHNEIDDAELARQLQAEEDRIAQEEEEQERREERRQRTREVHRHPDNEDDDGAQAEQRLRNLTIDHLRFQDDDFDFELQTDMFSMEHFKRMIRKTFTDFHPGKFNLSNISLDDYIKVVTEQDMIAKYGPSLEGTDQNVLTLKNMPWVDLGDLPDTYDPLKDEAF